jgi:hypothetical protein
MRITSTPSIPAGQIENDHRGVASRDRERRFPGRRQLDVVPACAEIRPQRAEDLRLVVDTAHGYCIASKLTTIVSPPLGVLDGVAPPWPRRPPGDRDRPVPAVRSSPSR